MSDYRKGYLEGRFDEREAILDLLDGQGNLIGYECGFEHDTVTFIRNLVDFIEREYHT